ncbi:MAG TPA: SDR family NAD(P)-dependent oxidoreductase [Pirellulales bacterium]|nr:SDR family NAD(P)-dependent oxidoreductase [Pirellulales bacterium]
MTRRTLAASRVLITGASSGIGQALAVELARAGAFLVLNARRENELRKLADQVVAAGGQAVCAPGDVTLRETRLAALAAAQQQFGGLDILVNNAGVSAWGAFDQADENRLRRIMEVNFFALAEMTREALLLLKGGRRPLVVNIGSILGHRGIPLQTEYCASKFAVRGLSESLRGELARLGIDLLLVSPGTTETEFFEHLLEKTAEMPWGKPRGVPSSYVAAQIVRAMRSGRREIIPSHRGRLLVWLNRLAPSLVDAWMAKYTIK